MKVCVGDTIGWRSLIDKEIRTNTVVSVLVRENLDVVLYIDIPPDYAQEKTKWSVGLDQVIEIKKSALTDYNRAMQGV